MRPLGQRPVLLITLFHKEQNFGLNLSIRHFAQKLKLETFVMFKTRCRMIHKQDSLVFTMKKQGEAISEKTLSQSLW